MSSFEQDILVYDDEANDFISALIFKDNTLLFTDLNIIKPILDALNEEGYSTPTPIQQQAIPYILKGRDLLGCAQTGTGKTAAFAIPMLQQLAQPKTMESRGQRPIRALVLTPTRELAIQIQDSFNAYGRHLRLKNLVIFGGVNQNPQVDALKRGVDILVATPGRLLDLMSQGHIRLNEIEIFVLDEADRMLDMGFVHDVKKVITKIPAKRQTLFFSATMPAEIQSLANSILTQPEKWKLHPYLLRPILFSNRCISWRKKIKNLCWLTSSLIIVLKQHWYSPVPNMAQIKW
jgi:ATP-dependent RNA helicase RhlE